MKQSDVDIIEKAVAYDGYFRIDRYRLRHKLFAGGWGKEVVRELFERGHAAAVLPYDPVLDVVVLVEQFRIGAYAADCDPWLIEIIAGIIDLGETAEAVARREAVEEAGLDLGEIVKIADYLASPGGTSETVTLYCGLIDASGAGGIHGLAAEGEDIRVTILPFAAIGDLLAENRTHNATLIIALQWLMLHREDLRKRWR